ncbi:MAG: hypothetical protein QM709_05305 [Spongiibacteraceae bacterium]
MRAIANKFSRMLTVATLSAVLVAPQISVAQEVNEKPSALAMVGDLVIARPLTFSFMVIGAGVWLVSLPFTASGGNINEAGEVLVAGPARATFNRCLGCTQLGYKHNVD